MTTIHMARPRDLPDIHRMIQALSAFHGDVAEVSLSALQDIFFDRPVATALIARTGETPVGYAGLVPHTRLHSGARTLDIQHLFVADIHRGRGIGRKLIDKARIFAKRDGFFRLTIGTSPTNLAAQAAYRAIGFDEITGAGPRFQMVF